MSSIYQAVGSPKTLTASGVALSGPGMLLGFFCNSTSSGTIALADSTASGGTAFMSVTPTAGVWYPMPVYLSNGLYATIANTLNVTLVVA